MRVRLVLLLLVGAIWTAGSARGGAITAFVNDFDGFLEAAGSVTIIDFETLPNGNPAFSGALITPEFNYTDLGVTFSSRVPLLELAGNPISGFGLVAEAIKSNDPTRNWIIADFVEPAFAVGYFFPGRSELTIFNDAGGGLASLGFRRSGNDWFIGLISDEPIAFATADRGIEVAQINAFVFAPVPGPGTLILFAIGAVALVRRRFR